MNSSTKPPYAAVYDIPERPRAHVPKLPLLRYEDCPAINVSEADDEYYLTGYGDISISEQFDVVDTGEDEQKLRVPRLRHARPRARYQTQTTKAVSDPLEPEYFRNTVKATLANPPGSPTTDFRAFFENLLRKPPPTRRRQHTLGLPNSFASKAIDARPRQN